MSIRKQSVRILELTTLDIILLGQLVLQYPAARGPAGGE